MTARDHTHTRAFPDTSCIRARVTALPDFVDLIDDPQLGPIALLQAALQVTVAAIDAQHNGFHGELCDAITDCPDSAVALLTRLVTLRCQELRDLLAAYRLALWKVSDSPDDLCDEPF